MLWWLEIIMIVIKKFSQLKLFTYMNLKQYLFAPGFPFWDLLKTNFNQISITHTQLKSYSFVDIEGFRLVFVENFKSLLGFQIARSGLNCCPLIFKHKNIILYERELRVVNSLIMLKKNSY